MGINSYLYRNNGISFEDKFKSNPDVLEFEKISEEPNKLEYNLTVKTMDMDKKKETKIAIYKGHKVYEVV